MGRLIAGLLPVLVLVSGCASGSGQPSGQPTVTESARDARKAGLGGTDAASDLTDFSCAPGDDDRWKASGVITNPTERTASYAVTVAVSGVDGGHGAEGKQRTLPALPGDPTPFAIANLPVAAGVEPTCSVRVVRLR